MFISVLRSLFQTIQFQECLPQTPEAHKIPGAKRRRQVLSSEFGNGHAEIKRKKILGTRPPRRRPVLKSPLKPRFLVPNHGPSRQLLQPNQLGRELVASAQVRRAQAFPVHLGILSIGVVNL